MQHISFEKLVVFSRSKKTGRSCGFAFVEFKYREVAEASFEPGYKKVICLNIKSCWFP